MKSARSSSARSARSMRAPSSATRPLAAAAGRDPGQPARDERGGVRGEHHVRRDADALDALAVEPVLRDGQVEQERRALAREEALAGVEGAGRARAEQRRAPGLLELPGERLLAAARAAVD